MNQSRNLRSCLTMKKGALALFVAIILSCNKAAESVVQSCDSPIYCQGPLLDTVQRAGIFDDSKSFVDMIQLQDPLYTVENFKTFMHSHNDNPSPKDVASFVRRNFVSTGELEPWTPTDYNPNPKFLRNITDVTVRDFARQLVAIWPNLSRKVKSSVGLQPTRHSLIPLPNGFVVPGGRFKEIYYWDSYWIIKGLLLSEMTATVRGVLENFLSLVETYGFVPNGSRVYYLNRSQPPLLSLMVGLYVDETNDLGWLKKQVGTLERELRWWLTNRTVVVEKDGVAYRMARYACESGTPRPESYSEDLKTCEKHSDKEKCYKDLKSGAESGWDFSSRWFFNPDGSISLNLASIDIQRVIPVDLNSFLCKAFKELSRFYKLLGNEDNAEKWMLKHEELKKAIQVVLYDENDGIWYDFDSKLGRLRKYFFASNLTPLWAEAYNTSLKNHFGQRAADYLHANSLTRSMSAPKSLDTIAKFEGGLPTSLFPSGEQWDLPNAWPPLQDIGIMGLEMTGNIEAGRLAKVFADRNVNSFVSGFRKHRKMFEKYNAIEMGVFGEGGEYLVQDGFGWSNGVALSLIERFDSVYTGGGGVSGPVVFLYCLNLWCCVFFKWI